MTGPPTMVLSAAARRANLMAGAEFSVELLTGALHEVEAEYMALGALRHDLLRAIAALEQQAGA